MQSGAERWCGGRAATVDGKAANVVRTCSVSQPRLDRTFGVSEQLARAVQRERQWRTLGSEIARRVLPAPNGEHEQELH